MKFKIENKVFGPFNPLIVAEISANHNQSLHQTYKLISEAKRAGADAIKLQTYTPDSITLNCDKKDFIINNKKSLWNKRKLYNLYEQGSLPYDWHSKIFEKAKKLGLIVFSTPFDVESVKFLENLKCPIYKVASFEINHIPLLQRISQTKKPVILSTGMATYKEIKDAVQILKQNKNKIILLKCTSNYPSLATDANIKTMIDMKDQFSCGVGVSDHTLGIAVSITAALNGASVIEKHITLDRNVKGLDSEFSMEPKEFKFMVDEIKNSIYSLGKVHYGPVINEKKSLNFKRSIYASDIVNKGDIFTEKNIKIIRPGYGLHPREYGKLLGQKSKRNYKFGQPIKKNN